MSEHALPEEDRVRPSPGARHLWFALLGASGAWFIHFLACYLLLEVACVAGWQQRQFLGLNGVAAAVMLATLLCLPVAIVSGLVAWRALRQGANARDEAGNATSERTAYLGKAGLILSVLFCAVIVAETIPALVLRPCPFA
jgi:uncharacterized membrane protein YcjF (UPF0283 family)